MGASLGTIVYNTLEITVGYAEELIEAFMLGKKVGERVGITVLRMECSKEDEILGMNVGKILAKMDGEAVKDVVTLLNGVGVG